MSELEAPAAGQVRMTYWVDFVHPTSRSQTWSNALRDESEEKAWASVKQLRCWYYTHRVSVLRYDPEGGGRAGVLDAAEWDRKGRQTGWLTESWPEYPEWMFRDVHEEDRVPSLARSVT